MSKMTIDEANKLIEGACNQRDVIISQAIELLTQLNADVAAIGITGIRGLVEIDQSIQHLTYGPGGTPPQASILSLPPSA